MSELETVQKLQDIRDAGYTVIAMPDGFHVEQGRNLKSGAMSTLAECAAWIAGYRQGAGLRKK